MSLTILSVFLAHLPSLFYHLVADSWVFMMPGSFFETLRYFFKSIIPPEWKSLWLRPVPMLFLWLDRVIWPGSEWGPHLMNILFHVCNAWLIWELMSFIRSGKGESQRDISGGLPACVACLVYGLHPLTVGSVNWVAARFDVMCVTFGLSGMLLWLKWDAASKNRRFLLWSMLFLTASILSKEQGIVYLMACFAVSLLRSVSAPAVWKQNRKGLILLGVLVTVYMMYRLVLFNGLGGYLGTQQGLSITPPLYFLLAVFFPYANLFPGRTFSWMFGLTALLIFALCLYQWKTPRTGHRIQYIYTFAAVVLVVLGLSTTAPHHVMSLKQIIGHGESRFALIAITGFSLLVGIAVNSVIHSKLSYKIVLILLMLWGVTAAWRTNVQIQAWKDAGIIADSIIKDTLRFAPDPPKNSHLIFIDIPRNNDQFAYIFGIGLKEALLIKYKNREDITIIRYPKRNDLGRARPERDFVFQYHIETRELEKLRAHKEKRNRQIIRE